MRKTEKVILIVVAVLGLVALAAGVAVAAGAAGSDPVIAQQPADDENGRATDDDGSDGDTDDESGQRNDSGESLTGGTATKAGDAALASIGGGTVLAVEADDGGEGYEVEIRRTGGSEVEVALDKAFKIVRRGEDD